MISTVLVEHPWLSPTALALLVVAGVPLGASLAGRPRAAWLLGALAVVPVLALTLVPVDRDLVVGCALQWSLPTPGRVELMANVVLFVAPALLAGVASRRPLLVLAGASAFSAVLELAQALLPAIGRSCDTNDWSANTLGAAIGVGLAWLALRRVAGGAARRRAPADAPRA